LTTPRLAFSALTGALMTEAHNRLMDTGKVLRISAAAD
jgi:hypothetical protein